jgi:hypothetical protein
MTEPQWLSCKDPVILWREVESRNLDQKERKVRLLACACCRRVWHLLTDERSRDAVDGAERYADRRLKLDRLKVLSTAAWEAVQAARQFSLRSAAEAVGDASGIGRPTPCAVSFSVADAIAGSGSIGRPSRSDLMTTPKWRRAQKLHAALTRDIFGNPFRAVTIETTWRSKVVIALTKAAYDNRNLPEGTLEPDRLAVLADALEDAGCTDAAILEHLRGAGPHVRGCWAVDLLLGKS